MRLLPIGQRSPEGEPLSALEVRIVCPERSWPRPSLLGRAVFVQQRAPNGTYLCTQVPLSTIQEAAGTLAAQAPRLCLHSPCFAWGFSPGTACAPYWHQDGTGAFTAARTRAPGVSYGRLAINVTAGEVEFKSGLATSSVSMRPGTCVFFPAPVLETGSLGAGNNELEHRSGAVPREGPGRLVLYAHYSFAGTFNDLRAFMLTHHAPMVRRLPMQFEGLGQMQLQLKIRGQYYQRVGSFPTLGRRGDLGVQQEAALPASLAAESRALHRQAVETARKEGMAKFYEECAAAGLAAHSFGSSSQYWLFHWLKHVLCSTHKAARNRVERLRPEAAPSVASSRQVVVAGVPRLVSSNQGVKLIEMRKPNLQKVGNQKTGTSKWLKVGERLSPATRGNFQAASKKGQGDLNAPLSKALVAQIASLGSAYRARLAMELSPRCKKLASKALQSPGTKQFLRLGSRAVAAACKEVNRVDRFATSPAKKRRYFLKKAAASKRVRVRVAGKVPTGALAASRTGPF